jgi:hypothetical protein
MRGLSRRSPKSRRSTRKGRPRAIARGLFLHLPRVIVPLATVEVARAHAATLESAWRSRTGRDRSGRASQPAPCRRGRPGVRAEPSSRTGIPLLRLPDGSKGEEVLEFVVARHVGPPLNCLARRPGQGSVAEGGDSVRRGTTFGDRPAFGRKERQADDGPTTGTPSFVSAVRSDSRRQDIRDSWLATPGQLPRPVAVGR